MNTVAVIDYGMGNLHSVAKAMEHVGAERVLVTSDAETILNADRVIFPGVGAMRDCMAEIRRRGLDQVLPQVLAAGKPLLGICVGMQALMRHSEENNGVDALQLLPGHVHFFGNELRDAFGQQLKVPHMGWNQVEQVRPHPLWAEIPNLARFYFVHSYYIRVDEPGLIAGRGHYGVEFVAAVAQNNLFAVQFHPEKSQKAGLQLLKNFLHWNGEA